MSELALTDRESRKLKSLEDSITRAAGDMYDAMRQIHDEKLYRENYGTWAHYCRGRWGMSERHALRLIEHGRVLALLSDDDKIGPIGPISEAATREVADLPDDAKVEVLQEVASENNGKVTANRVREHVQHQREPGDESEESGADPVVAVVLDAIDRPVPRHLSQKHETGAKLKSVGTKLDAVKREIKELVDEAGGVFLPLQQIEIAIRDVKGLIVQSRYYTECPRCRGKVKDSCDRCDGHGFLPYSRKGTLSDDDKLWLGVQ